MTEVTNDERVQRYAETLCLSTGLGAEYAAHAVMAVADAEQAELRAEVERLKAAPFACDTHMCGSCKGCRAAKVRDLVTEKQCQIDAAERALAEERESLTLMAEQWESEADANDDGRHAAVARAVRFCATEVRAKITPRIEEAP
jgi:hypothetical protein